MIFKVVFIGGLTNGNRLLDFLNKDIDTNIELVITYPEKKINPRQFKINNNNYKKVIYDFNASNHIDLIRRINPDFIFVCGWSYIIPKNILDIAIKASIGFHPSKLPLDRGRSVLAWQIEGGYSNTALSMFHLSEGVDSGDIIDQIIITIDDKENINDILNKIDIETENIISKNYPLLKIDKANRSMQNEKYSTYRKLRDRSNSLINWNLPAKDIHNKIRAIKKPYPGAEGFLGKNKYKFWKSELSEKKKNYLKFFF